MGLLKDAGLDEFYLLDVFGMNRALEQMGQRGMPVCADTRLKAAQELEQQRQTVLAELQTLIPDAVKPRKVYKRLPKKVPPGQLRCEATAATDTLCAYCGAKRPTKKHPCFKDKPYSVEEQLRLEPGAQWVRLLPFVPSSKGLLLYFKHKGYAIPKLRDKATGQSRDTTNEAAILRMALKYEDDPVLAKVLLYRDVQKQLSTYIGYPE